MVSGARHHLIGFFRILIIILDKNPAPVQQSTPTSGTRFSRPRKSAAGVIFCVGGRFVILQKYSTRFSWSHPELQGHQWGPVSRRGGLRLSQGPLVARRCDDDAPPTRGRRGGARQTVRREFLTSQYRNIQVLCFVQDTRSAATTARTTSTRPNASIRRPISGSRSPRWICDVVE